MNFEKLLGQQVVKKHNAIHFSPILHWELHIGPSKAPFVFVVFFIVLLFDVWGTWGYFYVSLSLEAILTKYFCLVLFAFLNSVGTDWHNVAKDQKYPTALRTRLKKGNLF